ncbi:FG-GAP repeat protein [Streptomyces sp. NPDC002490]|uniref:FG-GAP repeat protein n=1 Tax=Streptomyces sp. NPDC002490 TaxID=3154416 RepID=UPI003318DD3D
MRNKRSATALAAASFLLAAGAGLTVATPAHAGTPGGTYAHDRNSDFDGDGHEDTVIAAPEATVHGARSAGHVTVRYGSERGPAAARSVRISQATPGIPGEPERGDRFGAALATGDLNGDLHDELVVAAPGEDLSGRRDAGGVTVLWGGPEGLTGSATWVRARELRPGARFGTALAAARFSAAHPGDLLVVGSGTGGLERLTWAPVPPPVDGGPPGGDTPGGIAPMGTAGTHAAVRAGAKPIERAPLAGGRALLPRALTTGDYNRDDLADLVVTGVRGDGSPAHPRSAYYTGGARGPVFARELTGGQLAASGDIDGDGYDDLVSGHPAHTGGPLRHGGGITVRYGGPDGPSARPQWWTQDSPGVAGVDEAGDGFGSDVSVADADGDGYADVAVGAAGEDVGATADAGAVWVLRGSATGLTGLGSSHWTQDSRHLPGRAERGDAWGEQLRFTGPDRRGQYALLVAAPGEDRDAGRVWLLPAALGGVTAEGATAFGAGRPASDAGRFGAVIDE